LMEEKLNLPIILFLWHLHLKTIRKLLWRLLWKTVDTVLVTYTLCTIPEVAAALTQMRRVLKPDGKLIFCEHGQAPDPSVRRWQDRLNPIWGKFSGGCHLNRPIDALVKQAGFEIETLDTGYIASPKFAGFNYWGTAKLDG